MQLLQPTYLLMDKGMNGLNCDWQKNNQNAELCYFAKRLGVFGPLPLGGSYHDLEQAKHAIARFYEEENESE